MKIRMTRAIQMRINGKRVPSRIDMTWNRIWPMKLVVIRRILHASRNGLKIPEIRLHSTVFLAFPDFPIRSAARATVFEVDVETSGTLLLLRNDLIVVSLAYKTVLSNFKLRVWSLMGKWECDFSSLTSWTKYISDFRHGNECDFSRKRFRHGNGCDLSRKRKEDELSDSTLDLLFSALDHRKKQSQLPLCRRSSRVHFVFFFFFFFWCDSIIPLA